MTKSLEKFSVQWMQVAGFLNLPDYVINSIHVSRLEDDKASLRKVVEWWFKNTANPEWSAIRKISVKGIIKSKL